MTRQIDSDELSDLTVEQKVFRGAKRVCLTFAACALTLSTLDIAGVRSAENAADFWQTNRDAIVALPGTIVAGLHNISREASAVAVAVKIPGGPFLSGKHEPTPIDTLADIRNQDAVEVAMFQPVAAEVKAEVKAETKIEAKPESLAAMAQAPAQDPATEAKAAEPMRLATAEPGLIPPMVSLAPTPVSLPLQDATPIPLGKVPLPREAPGLPPPSPAQLLNLDDKAYAKAEHCLARAIYFEARSEPVRGQEAVAQVVMNRVFSGFYPRDVCAVIYQNANRRLACQFTFACDGKRKVINERGAWARANRIAKQTLDGKLYVPAVAKSTHYHAAYVHPYWTREMHKLARFGIHTFYRPIAWGNGSYEPVWGSGAKKKVTN
ncbi:MAG TPA: cell wall hydrolase [Pseudolabrys sp.]|nr:cell wall hydrolase [Pseudolabrys sp.]